MDITTILFITLPAIAAFVVVMEDLRTSKERAGAR